MTLGEREANHFLNLTALFWGNQLFFKMSLHDELPLVATENMLHFLTGQQIIITKTASPHKGGFFTLHMVSPSGDCDTGDS